MTRKAVVEYYQVNDNFVGDGEGAGRVAGDQDVVTS